MLSSCIASGDCLIVARSDGRYEVFKVWAKGARQPVHGDTADRLTAWQVAQTLLDPEGGAVYYKHEAEPDSAIRPYPSHETALSL
jgi:hypothetical protein